MTNDCEKYKRSHVLIKQHFVDAGHKDDPKATAKSHKEMFLNGTRVGRISEIEFIEKCHKKKPNFFASWYVEDIED